MVYSVAWGKLIHEKNQNSKISWHCPFNVNEFSFINLDIAQHISDPILVYFSRYSYILIDYQDKY